MGAGVFFSEKGAISNFFFFEKGAVGQKRLGACGLDNQLTDGREVVRCACRALLPRNIFWYSFVLEAE
jgi:hypothetical protein